MWQLLSERWPGKDGWSSLGIIIILFPMCSPFPLGGLIALLGLGETTNDRLARKINFVQKKHLKIAYFGGHKSGLPDFGRPWRPNG